MNFHHQQPEPRGGNTRNGRYEKQAFVPAEPATFSSSLPPYVVATGGFENPAGGDCSAGGSYLRTDFCHRLADDVSLVALATRGQSAKTKTESFGNRLFVTGSKFWSPGEQNFVSSNNPPRLRVPRAEWLCGGMERRILLFSFFRKLFGFFCFW